MDGRRVSRRRQRRNPLYMIFMGLLAAVLVLVIAVVVLSVRLGSANRDLAAAQEKIEQLQSGSTQQGGDDFIAGDDLSGNDAQDAQDGIVGADDGQSAAADTGADSQQTAAGTDVIDWLDLTGHSEISVKPKSVYDKYYIYYTSDGVNLRAGPGTSYDKVKLLDLGTEVKAAAKQDGWTFVSVDGKFGWINSDYLSTTRPEPKKTEAPVTSSGSTASGDSGASSDTGASQTGNTAGDTATEPDSGSSEMPEWLKIG